MSSWRNAVKVLYSIGGEGSAQSVDKLAGLGIDECGNALRKAAYLGLVNAPGRSGRNPAWTITQRGIDFCENRVTQVGKRPGGRHWVSTWLSSLPRGIRITEGTSA